MGKPPSDLVGTQLTFIQRPSEYSGLARVEEELPRDL